MESEGSDRHEGEWKMDRREDLDDAWACKVANSVMSDLVYSKIVREEDWKKAEGVIAQAIFVHLVSGDRPEGLTQPK